MRWGDFWRTVALALAVVVLAVGLGAWAGSEVGAWAGGLAFGAVVLSAAVLAVAVERRRQRNMARVKKQDELLRKHAPPKRTGDREGPEERPVRTEEQAARPQAIPETPVEDGAGGDSDDKIIIPLGDSCPDDGKGGDGGGNGEDLGGEREPRPRFLTGTLPERAPAGARISLLVQVTLAAVQGASAAMKGFPVSPTGTIVTITVSAPELVPLGDLEQELSVPFAADSEPVRFGFIVAQVGLHSVRVRAFAGGTCLGELTLEISVETGATMEEGRPRAAPMAGLAAEPGEVTLQVSRTAGGGYSFQLLSEAFYPVVLVDRLAGDPATVIGQMVAELRTMSKGTSRYATPALARRRLRSLGSTALGRRGAHRRSASSSGHSGQDQAVHDRQRHGHRPVGAPLSRRLWTTTTASSSSSSR